MANGSVLSSFFHTLEPTTALYKRLIINWFCIIQSKVHLYHGTHRLFDGHLQRRPARRQGGLQQQPLSMWTTTAAKMTDRQQRRPINTATEKQPRTTRRTTTATEKQLKKASSDTKESSEGDKEREEETYDDVFEYLTKGSYPKDATERDKGVIRRRAKSFQVVDGILHYKGKEEELRGTKHDNLPNMQCDTRW